MAARLERRQARLHGEHRALDVAGEDLVDVGLGHLREQLLGEDAGVGAEHVDAAEPLDRGVRDQPAVSDPGDVRDDGLDAAAGLLAEVVGGGLQRALVPGRDQDVRARAHEDTGDALADALAATGDDHRAAVQRCEHRVLLLVAVNARHQPKINRTGTGTPRPARSCPRCTPHPSNAPGRCRSASRSRPRAAAGASGRTSAISASSVGDERPHAPVATHPRVGQLGDPRVVLEEADRRAEVVEEPAPAAVVEVDDVGLVTVDEQVRQPQVGVDQPVAVRPGAEVARAASRNVSSSRPSTSRSAAPTATPSCQRPHRATEPNEPS